MIEVVPLAPALLPAWAGLFEAAASACYCRYWHFDGTKNDWLERCAGAPLSNRDEQSARVRAEDPGARGLLALEGGAAIGWMKLAPRACLPKLRRQSVYRALDLGDDEGVYSVGCFLVHPAHRDRGVARALLVAADDVVRAWGGRALEGYPRSTLDRVHAEQAWQGPESIFVGCGFAPIHADGPYPVYRKQL